MALITYELRLIAVKTIAPGVKHFVWERVDGVPADFIPGQFITLHLPGAEGLVRRSYSIASIPGQDSTIDFAASYVAGGIASEFLFHLPVGSTVLASGPVGRLILREESVKRYFLVGTGTGITPYRAMLPELEQRLASDSQLEVIILQGARTQADILYCEDFLRLASSYPERYQFFACYSREQAVTAPHEWLGYVQTKLQQLAPIPNEDVVYLCGNPHMIDESFELMKQIGFDQVQVRREKYISSR